MNRKIEYLDQDASPVTIELYTESNVIISGDIIGTEISLVDPGGNEYLFVVKMVDGKPHIGGRPKDRK